MDTLKAISDTRRAFLAVGLEPPDVIILKSRKDGMKIIHEFRMMTRDPSHLHDMGSPVEHPDGSVWMEVEVQDIKVRWPANKFALTDKSYAWA